MSKYIAILDLTLIKRNFQKMKSGKVQATIDSIHNVLAWENADAGRVARLPNIVLGVVYVHHRHHLAQGQRHLRGARA
jgi:hypothetical protein